MKKTMKWMRLSDAPVFSPKGFLIRAGVLVALFAIAHLLGWREYTTILCGGAPSADAWVQCRAGFGVAYVILYFLAILGAPILILALGILAVMKRLTSIR